MAIGTLDLAGVKGGLMSKGTVASVCVGAFLVGMGATIWMMLPHEEAKEITPVVAESMKSSSPTPESKDAEVGTVASEPQVVVAADDTGKVVGTISVAAVGSDQASLGKTVVTPKPAKAGKRKKSPIAASQDVPLAEDEGHQKEWSLALTLMTGFKPEYYESEDPGRYNMASIRYSRRFKSGVGISVSVPVVQTEEPEETVVSDPTIAVSKGLGKLPGKIPVAAKLSFKPGVSERSQEADYYGSVSAGLSMTKTTSIVTLGIAGRYTKRLHKYTFSSLGITNTSHSESASGFVSLELPASTSVTGSLAYIRSVPYEGDARYIFSNGVDFSWQASNTIVISTGLSRTDSQLQPNGEDNNVFTVYKQNQTEMYLSVTYAL